MKLMIVDDEVTMRDMLSSIFELENGVEIFCCQDGEQAIESYSNIDPDVVILDLMMPKVDGFKVCKTIKDSDPVRPKIVILSGLAGEDIRRKCKALGADEVFFKPVDINALITAVMK